MPSARRLEQNRFYDPALSGGAVQVRTVCLAWAQACGGLLAGSVSVAWRQV